MLDEILVIDAASSVGVHPVKQGGCRGRREVDTVPLQRCFEAFQRNLVISNHGLAPKYLQAGETKSRGYLLWVTRRASQTGRSGDLENFGHQLTGVHRLFSNNFQKFIPVADAGLLFRKLIHLFRTHHVPIGQSAQPGVNELSGSNKCKDKLVDIPHCVQSTFVYRDNPIPIVVGREVS